MTNAKQNRFGNLGACGLASVQLLLAVFALAVAVQAQTFTVLHGFSGTNDGSFPVAGLTIDGGGNLYGTAYFGGSGYDGPGTVFKLSPKGSGWIFAKLYGFHGANDGGNPGSRVIFGPNGSLYGTTVFGGTGGVGTVYSLRPAAGACLTALCPWSETVLYNFVQYTGWDANDIVFDSAGNLYGTTSQGGPNDGIVYELAPNNGTWVETTLNTMKGVGPPMSGVILDQAGNLYGTTYIGDGGTVYELTNPNWNLQRLHLFTYADGSDPFGALIFDKSGNLYGGTLCGGANGEGTIYELSPSNGGWTLTTLYNFTKGDQNYCGGPYGSLVMDASGALYGTTHSGGAYEMGSVFKLAPSQGGWVYTSLHDFCAGGGSCSDGCYPFGNVTFDSKGNLYGTASACGPNGQGEYSGGVVWEITP
jgi:uncharacterized repeat protein (TIGR03803 family)